MGREARLPRSVPPPKDELRALLALFPDRATYEQWLTARAVSPELTAHMELLLPPRLQVSGTV